MKKSLFLVVLIFNLISCQHNITIPDPSDQELLDIAYSDIFMYVEDFYDDGTDGSVYYVNTISSTPRNSNTHTWFDHATNDYQKALEWTENTHLYSSVSFLERIAERETEKFFEFSDMRSDSHIVAYRIHKLDYFAPLVDRLNVQSDTMGIYHGEMSSEKVKEFSEYMFYRHRFTTTDHIGVWFSKILDSSVRNDLNHYVSTIETMKIIGGDWGLADEILIYNVITKVHKQTGYVTFSAREIHRVTGRMN